MKAATWETGLIEHAPDAIIFADRTGVILVWNHRAEALFGHSAEEAVGQTLDLIVPEPYRPAHWAGFSRAVQLGRFANDDALLTSRALTKGGGIIAVELSAAIMWSPSGDVSGIMAIGRDVTERRAREQAQHERIVRLEREVAVAMPLLFAYGTLQQENVQRSTFGRLLQGQEDELPGFEHSLVRIEDPRVVATSGQTHYSNVTFNGSSDSRVRGTVFEITDAELAAADQYEQVAAYTRVAAILASGKQAWVYVNARSAPGAS